jgi:hypothetical protein
MDLQGVGTLLIGIVGALTYIEARLAKRAAKRASQHAEAATASLKNTADANVRRMEAISQNVAELATNTNSKMDALIAAKETAADLVGEKRGTEAGIAQEMARRNKDNT